MDLHEEVDKALLIDDPYRRGYRLGEIAFAFFDSLGLRPRRNVDELKGYREGYASEQRALREKGC